METLSFADPGRSSRELQLLYHSDDEEIGFNLLAIDRERFGLTAVYSWKSHAF